MLLDAAKLNEVDASVDHVKMLVSEVKALKVLPGGKFCSFLIFRKLPPEVRQMVWKEAAREVKQEVIIEAYRAVTPGTRHAKMVVNFRRLSQLNTLHNVCKEARNAVLKVRNVKDQLAYCIKCVLNGVKNVVVDQTTGQLGYPWFAHKLKNMFPDLECVYVMSEEKGSRALGYYTNHPNEYELIPKSPIFFKSPAFDARTWQQTWAWAESFHADEQSKPCPQAKMMTVVKRTRN